MTQTKLQTLLRNYGLSAYYDALRETGIESLEDFANLEASVLDKIGLSSESPDYRKLLDLSLKVFVLLSRKDQDDRELTDSTENPSALKDETETEAEPEFEKPRKPKNKTVTVIASIVCILCIGFLCVYFNLDKIKASFCNHQWVEATCKSPKTCTRCGLTEGYPLDHVVNDWKVIKESTCSDKGYKTGTCNLCGKKITAEFPLASHTLGEWYTSKEPTYDKAGKMEQKCTVCKKVINTKNITLSEAEKAEYYKKSCEPISFQELSRYPETHKGKLVHLRGEIVQELYAQSASQYCTYRVDITCEHNQYFGDTYTDTVYVLYDGYGKTPRLIEGDIVDIYGTSEGLYSYTSVLGSTITLPKIKAEYMSAI